MKLFIKLNIYDFDSIGFIDRKYYLDRIIKIYIPDYYDVPVMDYLSNRNTIQNIHVNDTLENLLLKIENIKFNNKVKDLLED